LIRHIEQLDGTIPTWCVVDEVERQRENETSFALSGEAAINKMTLKKPAQIAFML
jgi:hypothetical protein